MTSALPLQSRPYTKQPISLAPMIDKTNRDWRWVMRRITKRSLLYTEMIAAPAVLRGDRKRILSFDSSEKPLVLQLGWDEAEDLAEVCRIAENYGYDEINLNCGCPSDKVQRHDFGACLMARPDHVARLIEAMSGATSLPITVKNRIGIRSKKTGLSLEAYGDLKNFTRIVAGAGCGKFIVHARIAVLEGLSPRENRDVPPLRYEDVFRLKRDFPNLFIEINGGFTEAEAVDEALKSVDAVMLGRIALDNPWMLSGADSRWFGDSSRPPSRREVLEEILPYLARRACEGASAGNLIQPLMGFFAGKRGAKAWKRALTKIPSASPASFESLLRNALGMMDGEVLDIR